MANFHKRAQSRRVAPCRALVFRMDYAVFRQRTRKRRIPARLWASWEVFRGARWQKKMVPP